MRRQGWVINQRLGNIITESWVRGIGINNMETWEKEIGYWFGEMDG